MINDPIERFAINLVDDLRAVEEIQKRDENDTGRRITLEDLVREQGFSLKDLDDR